MCGGVYDIVVIIDFVVFLGITHRREWRLIYL